MNIFPNHFYEPSESELGLNDFNQKVKEKKDKKENLIKIAKIDFNKIKFIPINLDDER